MEAPTMKNLSLAARATATLILSQPQATLVVSIQGAGGSSTAFQNSATVRAINLTLAILAFLLTAFTYGMLIKYSAHLSNQFIIPRKFIHENKTQVLKELRKTRSFELHEIGKSYGLYAEGESTDPEWETVKDSVIEESLQSHLDRFASGMPRPTIWRKLKVTARKLFKIQHPRSRESSRILHLFSRGLLATPSSSPAMRYIVQASIWEWVAVWLALIALVNTLTYNGFITGDKTPDMMLRLIIVSIYAAAVAGHTLYITHFNVCQILSCLTLQATWQLLMMKYAVVWRDSIDEPCCPQALVFEGFLMGETKVKEFLRGVSPESYSQVIPLDGRIIQAQDPESAKTFFETAETTQSLVENKIKPILESEVKVLEKSAEATLERAQANITILLGICLSTGLAPWTSTKLTDATSTQLGSYALLFSVSAGILALTSSFSYFSTVTSSARMLLKLKENMLSATVDEHFKRDNVQPWNVDRPARFGFSCSSDFFGSIAPPGGRFDNYPKTEITGYPVTIRRLWSLMNINQCLWSVFFGPVLIFLTKYLDVNMPWVIRRTRFPFQV
ncbi:hypothetical protein F4680DRAFT_448861 [Xylaria scruposa]|nr:hypothetical protein F4680DRAFT_448861 [Xylaria scruposa]